MGLKDQFQTAIKKIDLFATTQFVRFKNQQNYGTLTGGLITIFLSCLFLIAFINSATSLYSADNMNTTTFINFQNNPQGVNLTFGQDKMMFAFKISNVDFRANQRIFDIDMVNIFKNGSQIKNINIPLDFCTQKQWSDISPIGKQIYHNINLQNALCPVSGSMVEIGGKFSSTIFNTFQFNLKKCNDSLDLSRPCNKQVTLSSQYKLQIYFMNPYINIASLQPIDFYIEDRNYLPLDIDYMINANLYLSQNIIKTDESLLPWSNDKQQTIYNIPNSAQIIYSSLTPTNNYYMQINFRKSIQSFQYVRSYKKLDQLFSYLGGLLGFALLGFFLLNFYNQASFQIEMGDKLFHYSPDSPLDEKRFNFIWYLGYLCYLLTKIIGLQIQWKSMQRYCKCREQVVQQLDISLLLNKITYLQKCMMIIFEEHQFRAIYLQKKPTVEEAQQLRQNHGLNAIIHQNNFDQDEQKLKQFLESDIFLAFQNKLFQIISAKTQKKSQVCRISIQQQLQKNPQQRETYRKSIEHHYQQLNFLQILKGLGQNQKIKNQQVQQYKQNDAQIIKNQQILVNSQINKESKKLPQTFYSQNKIASTKYTKQEQNKIKNQTKFIQKVIQDMKKIENQAKSGNIVSQKIFHVLNNRTTMQNFVILKYLEDLTLSKKALIVQENEKIQTKMQKINENIASSCHDMIDRKQNKLDQDRQINLFTKSQSKLIKET